MNYYQPVYTLVTQKALADTLTERHGPYQRALTQLMELEVISDGNYRPDVQTVTHGQNPRDVKLADIHTCEILEMLDIMNGAEYSNHRQTIRHWFGNTVRQGTTEYALLNGQWYAREWESKKLGKPKHLLGTIYFRDYHIGQSDSCGLSILFNSGKKGRMLVNGGKMESRTKLTIAEQQKFIRNYANREKDASTSEKIRQHSLKIDNRLVTVRTENVNDTAAEILGYSRNVVFCGPTTLNDEQHSRRIGVAQLISFMHLIALMVRRNESPIEIIEADTRMMRPVYDNNPQNGHEVIAAKLAEFNYQMICARQKL